MSFNLSSLLGKGKGKGHPVTYLEGTERGGAGSSISLTSAMEGGWVVNATSWSLYPCKREPVRVLQEAGWALKPAWTCAEDLTPTDI